MGEADAPSGGQESNYLPVAAVVNSGSASGSGAHRGPRHQRERSGGNENTENVPPLPKTGLTNASFVRLEDPRDTGEATSTEILSEPDDEEEHLVTYHGVKLNGDNWVDVLRGSRAVFDDALGADVCDMLALPRSSVRDVKVGADGQSVMFGVRHPFSLQKDEVNKALESCRFTSTLKLYDLQTDSGPLETDSPVLKASESAPPSLRDEESSQHGDIKGASSVKKIKPRNHNIGACSITGHSASVEVLYGAIYDEDAAVTHHRVKFNGNNWDSIVHHKGMAIREAFDTDVSNALGLPRGSVEDVTLAPDGLSMSFSVRHPASLRRKDVNKILAKCPFENTWRLYESKKSFNNSRVASFVLRSSVNAPPSLRAEEDVGVMLGDWDANPPFEFLVPATASQMTVVRPPNAASGECNINSMPDDILINTEGEGFGTVTRHEVKFEGDNWGVVHEKKRVAFDEAFDADICDTLGVPRGSVEDMVLAPDGQLVSFGVRHPASLGKKDINKALSSCPFENTWKLYEPKKSASPSELNSPVMKATKGELAPLRAGEVVGPTPLEVGGPRDLAADGATAKTSGQPVDVETNVLTRHRVKFHGDNWGVVHEKKRVAFDEAFDADICGALGVPRGSVEDMVLASDGQLVSFGVRHPASLGKKDINKALSSCPFENTWKLYEPKKSASPSELNSPVMKATKGELAPLRAGEVVGPTPLEVGGPRDLAADGATAKTSGQPVEREDGCVTSHALKLEGDNWGAVYEKKRVAFDEAFDADICDTLGVPRGSVEDMVLAPDGQLVSFGVRHPTSLGKKDINKALSSCPFENTWKLYEPKKSASPSRFDSLVLMTSKSELAPLRAEEEAAGPLPDASDAFPSATAAVSNLLPARAIRSRYFSSGECNITTSGATPIALYGALCDSDTVVTRHRVRFNGENWDLVLQRRRAELDDALDADVSEALDLPRGSVSDIEYVPDGLTASFGVRHPAAFRRRDIARLLSKGQFANLWKMYPRSRNIDTLGPSLSSLKASEKAPPNIVGGEVVPPAPNFCQSRAKVDAAGLPTGASDTVTPSDYTNGQQSVMKTDKRGSVVDGGDTIITCHRVKLSGANWVEVVETKRAAFDEAFDTDVCEALGFPLGCVEDVLLGPDGHSVTFAVRHSASLQKSDVKKVLRLCPFANTLQLYHSRRTLPSSEVASTVLRATEKEKPAPTPRSHGSAKPSTVKVAASCDLEGRGADGDPAFVEVFNGLISDEDTLVTRHGVLLNGENWLKLHESKSAAFNDAFDADVCEALGLPCGNVEGIKLNPDGHLVTFGVRHPISQRREDINRALGKCRYQNLMKLYNSRSAVYSCVATSPMLRATETARAALATQESISQPAVSEVANTTSVGVAKSRNLLDGSAAASNSASVAGLHAFLSDQPVVTQHGIKFSGANWADVIEGRAMFDDALDADVCEAVGLPRGSVEDILLSSDGRSVAFGVRHPASISKGDINQALDNCRFVNTLRLYVSRCPPVVYEASRPPLKAAEAEQSSLKAAETQRPPIKATEAEQSSLKAAETKRPPLKAAEVEQSSLKAAETKRPPLKAAEVEQSSLKAAEAEQSSLKAAEAEQSSLKATEAEQSSLKAAEINRSPPRAVETKRPPLKATEAKRPPLKVTEARRAPPARATEVERPPLKVVEISSPTSFVAGPRSVGLVNPPSLVDTGIIGSSSASFDILYGSLKDEGAVVTEYRAKLNGSHWRVLLQHRFLEFEEAFYGDVCDALSLTKGSVDNMELDSDMQAFSFGVRHRRSLEPSAVLRQLGEYHFSKTREFCDSQKRFGVVVDDHDQLLTLEIASKQELPEADDGCDEDLRHLQTSGRSDLPSSPSSPLCIKKTNTRTMHFGNTGAGAVRLPKTRKYEAAPANATVTQHRVQFVAENCGHVADETREKVPQALNLDVCDALGISWKCVEEVTLSPDGRLVTFGVRHSPKMSRGDVRSALIAHDFPYTWKVYEPDTLVEFESGVERTTAEQKSQATPKATSTSSIYFSPSSVPPFVRVAEPQNFVKDSFTISNTASLEVLHTAIGDGTVVTKHRVKFNGDNWGAVLEKKRAAFDEAFDADVCDALDLPRGSVEGITLGSDGLSIDFGVRHPASLHKDEVDHFLSTSEFPAMWNLYEPKKKVLSSIVMGDTEERETTSFSTSLPQRASPVSAKEFPSCLHPAPGVASSSVPMDRADGASGSGNVCHLYRVGFVGGFWSGIVDKRFTAAVDCFMRDAAVGEGLVPRSVERVVSLDSGNVVFSVWMEHAAALSQSEVCTAMDNAPFPSMWKLYDDLINEGVVGRTTTLHRVGLVGSEWAHVANVDLVKEVFIQDVAEALRLSPEDINVNEYTVNDKLVIGFYVSHSHTLTEVDIDDMLANAPLSRVWGLCPAPGTNSWKAAHCKGSATSNSGSFPHTEPLRGGRFRDLSPIPLSGGSPAETPHDRRSNSQYRRSLGPLQGVVTPPMRRYDGHNQHSGRFYQANKRSPGQFSPPNQPVVDTKGVHAMRMSPQSGRFKAGSARGGGSLIAGSDPVRASLPRVDLLKVGELLALMRRRQLEEGSTRLPPLTGRAQPYPSCAPSTVKRYVGSK